MCLLPRSTGRRWYAKNTKTDEPIPFMRSKARTFRVVDDALSVDEKKMKKRNFVIPLGLVSFGIIIYFGFFRQEGKKDNSIMDYLTQDITSKIPEERRDNIPYPDSPK